MFPAPSPNAQVIYQQLANGGATPGTLDFHRTAMNAAAARKDNHKGPAGATSQPQEKRAPVAPMESLAPAPAGQPPAFGQHDNDAANGLYMLAHQAGNGPPPSNPFAVPKPPGGATASNHAPRSHDTSPTTTVRRVGTGGSIGESLSGSGRGVSEISGEASDSGDPGRSTTRTRGKRSAATKPAAPNHARRKTGDTPGKPPPPAKRPKTAGTRTTTDLSMMDMDGMDSDEEANIKEEQYHENGKKMTDEEKRKNFLERNR